eukprot:CFRG3255T1
MKEQHKNGDKRAKIEEYLKRARNAENQRRKHYLPHTTATKIAPPDVEVNDITITSKTCSLTPASKASVLLNGGRAETFSTCSAVFEVPKTEHSGSAYDDRLQNLIQKRLDLTNRLKHTPLTAAQIQFTQTNETTRVQSHSTSSLALTTTEDSASNINRAMPSVETLNTDKRPYETHIYRSPTPPACHVATGIAVRGIPMPVPDTMAIKDTGIESVIKSSVDSNMRPIVDSCSVEPVKTVKVMKECELHKDVINDNGKDIKINSDVAVVECMNVPDIVHILETLDTKDRVVRDDHIVEEERVCVAGMVEGGDDATIDVSNTMNENDEIYEVISRAIPDKRNSSNSFTPTPTQTVAAMITPTPAVPTSMSTSVADANLAEVTENSNNDETAQANVQMNSLSPISTTSTQGLTLELMPADEHIRKKQSASSPIGFWSWVFTTLTPQHKQDRAVSVSNISQPLKDVYTIAANVAEKEFDSCSDDISLLSKLSEKSPPSLDSTVRSSNAKVMLPSGNIASLAPPCTSTLTDKEETPKQTSNESNSSIIRIGPTDTVSSAENALSAPLHTRTLHTQSTRTQPTVMPLTTASTTLPVSAISPQTSKRAQSSNASASLIDTQPPASSAARFPMDTTASANSPNQSTDNESESLDATRSQKTNVHVKDLYIDVDEAENVERYESSTQRMSESAEMRHGSENSLIRRQQHQIKRLQLEIDRTKRENITAFQAMKDEKEIWMSKANENKTVLTPLATSNTAKIVEFQSNSEIAKELEYVKSEMAILEDKLEKSDHRNGDIGQINSELKSLLVASFGKDLGDIISEKGEEKARYETRVASLEEANKILEDANKQLIEGRDYWRQKSTAYQIEVLDLEEKNQNLQKLFEESEKQLNPVLVRLAALRHSSVDLSELLIAVTSHVSKMDILKEFVSEEEKELTIAEARSAMREGSVEDISASNHSLVDLLASSFVLAMTSSRCKYS